MSLRKFSRWCGAVARDTADLLFPRDCPGCGRPLMTDPPSAARTALGAVSPTTPLATPPAVSRTAFRSARPMSPPSSLSTPPGVSPTTPRLTRPALWTGSESAHRVWTGPESVRRVCTHCQWALDTAPKLVFPRVGLSIPTFSAGFHRGVRRRLLIAAKERGNTDAHYVNGVILRAMFQWLVHHGHLPDPRLTPWALVPAPTSEEAARARGGDVVVRWLRHATGSLATAWEWGSDGAAVCPILVSRHKQRDQVGLSSDERRRNVAATISVREPKSALVGELRRQVRAGQRLVIVVDDVLTTGATMQQCILALRGAGIEPTLGVTLVAA